MSEQIPVLYYDFRTISPEMLSRISEKLKGFFEMSIILPKEVDLVYMDKNDLIKELEDTINLLKEEEEENKKEEDNKNE